MWKSQVWDRDIANKILNIGLKRNMEDMIAVLKPVAGAIDIFLKKQLLSCWMCICKEGIGNEG